MGGEGSHDPKGGGAMKRRALGSRSTADRKGLTWRVRPESEAGRRLHLTPARQHANPGSTCESGDGRRVIEGANGLVGILTRNFIAQNLGR